MGGFTSNCLYLIIIGEVWDKGDGEFYWNLMLGVIWLRKR